MKTTTFGRLCLTACTTILLASVSASAQNAVYTLVNLGTLGGKRSMGLGINASGHVVGSAETVDGRTHGFVYVNTVPIDLGTFGGDQSYAYRINDQGLIVGRAAAGEEFRPFVSSATGGLFDISLWDSRLRGSYSTAVDINTDGSVVGYRQTDSDHMAAQNRVFRYRDFQVTDLGTFGGQDGVISAINKIGHMVGFYGTEHHADYADHAAFLVDDNGRTDLGSLGGRMATPTDINDSTQVVGYAQLRSGEDHAFLYQAGRLIDLGTLPGGTQSYAYAINNLGQAVGASDSSVSEQRSVLFDGGRVIDLNTLIPSGMGWFLTEARDINDSGQIVGTGIFNGHERAFLLSPVRK